MFGDGSQLKKYLLPAHSTLLGNPLIVSEQLKPSCLGTRNSEHPENTKNCGTFSSRQIGRGITFAERSDEKTSNAIVSIR